MPLYRNAFQDYTDEDWELPKPSGDCFWYTSERPLTREEEEALYRFAKHAAAGGDDESFEWPPHLAPDRERRVPIQDD